MEKINYVMNGPYKGKMVVYSQGAVWINTGIFTLLRLDEKAISSAEVADAERHILRITFRDGTESDLLMGPKLFAASVKALSGFITEGTRTAKAQPAAPVEPQRQPKQAKPKNSPLKLILALAAAGVALIVLLKLTGRL